MRQAVIKSIGRLSVQNGNAALVLAPEFVPGLAGLEGFGAIQILWWFDGCDNPRSRSLMIEENPYKKGPARLGTFSTRSPRRPNPIALSCAFVTCVDLAAGVIGLSHIDAYDGSPVIDIKPYTPSLDRVDAPAVPDWCAHWPGSIEASGDFDWDSEFNFE